MFNSLLICVNLYKLSVGELRCADMHDRVFVDAIANNRSLSYYNCATYEYRVIRWGLVQRGRA